MNNILTVLLVEDNYRTQEVFLDYAETLDDVKLIVASTAADAVQKIHDYLPHAVILDLELNQGDGSGLDVLQSIKDSALSRKPFFLITTIITSTEVYEHARSLGADYILYKGMKSYSEKYALDFLQHMREVLLKNNKQIHIPETPNQREKRIRSRITSELYNVGISPNMQGYHYLIDAIEMYIKEPQHQLYDIIAKKYGKTRTSVEKAMKNAIDKAWKTTDIDELVLHFKARIRADKGVPTIMEFICYYADKIKNE